MCLESRRRIVLQRAQVEAKGCRQWMESAECCHKCNSANVCVSTCACQYVLPDSLQGLEIQPEFPELSAHRGHPRLSKPQAGQARVQRNLWGPLPQLHTGTSAHTVLPADLRSGAGEIQRGKDVKPYAPCIHMACPSCSSSHGLLSPPCLLLSLRHINSNSVCVHISDTLSLPPVTSSDKQSSLR